jgi:hypothetical protein
MREETLVFTGVNWVVTAGVYHDLLPALDSGSACQSKRDKGSKS